MAALDGQLPPPVLPAPTLINVFAGRGFSADELVALVGAHSAGKNHTGVPFDTTVGELDSWTYYTETRDGGAPTTLPSDFFLSQYGQTRDSWNVYAVSQEAWVKDFVDGYVFFDSLCSLTTSHAPSPQIPDPGPPRFRFKMERY